MHCPVCHHSETKHLFSKNHFWISECDRCHHQFVELEHSAGLVSQIYDDAYFQNGGPGYPDYLKEREILVRHGRKYARLVAKYASPGELLDVGAAAGFILKGFIDSGWSGMGIEPNATMAAYGRKHFGLNLVTATLETFYSNHQFDLISMIQVVAHFYDLHQAFQQARALTKRSGFILVETWDRSSWLAKLLKSRWHEYNPPSVLHFFSAASLDRMLLQYGFCKIATGKPAKWISGQHIKSVLDYNLNNSKSKTINRRILGLIPDRLKLPYPAVDLFWALFKKCG